MSHLLKHAHFPYLAEKIHRLSLTSNKSLNVLDVGCGPGDLPVVCGNSENCNWIGVDLWRNQLVQALERRVYQYILQVNLLEGLPFRNESMDVVICSEVLMYLPDAPALLFEFHRVMAPGAVLCVYNPISMCPHLAASMKRLGRRIYQESGSVALEGSADWRNTKRPTRITFYSLKDLVYELSSADFEIMEVVGFRIFRNRIRVLSKLEKYSWHKKMTSYLTKHYPQLASDLMVTACKRKK